MNCKKLLIMFLLQGLVLSDDSCLEWSAQYDISYGLRDLMSGERVNDVGLINCTFYLKCAKKSVL